MSLRRTPVHVIVRDWPETLAALREIGVDVASAGGAALERAVQDAEAALAAIRDATSWRSDRRRMSAPPAV